MVRLLILGGSGFLGRRLFSHLGARATATYCGHRIDGGIHFDALNMKLSEAVPGIRAFSHAAILLGDTDPDSCVRNVERSQRLNVTSIIAIIEQLKYFGVMPVFISTEAVFDGKKGGYTETDPARPILTYGLQKREVECHLENGRQKYLVVRLARVFGPDHGDGTLFTSWLERIARGGVIRCASDQVFSPIHVDEACEGILRLIKKGCEGTFHLSGIDSMSRCSMLEMLIRFYEKYMPAKVEVEKCGINDFPVLEKRPLDVSMKPNKFVAHTSLALSSLEQHCGEITKAYFAR